LTLCFGAANQRDFGAISPADSAGALSWPAFLDSLQHFLNLKLNLAALALSLAFDGQETSARRRIRAGPGPFCNCGRSDSSFIGRIILSI
jgi:hypothetical protein